MADACGANGLTLGQGQGVLTLGEGAALAIGAMHIVYSLLAEFALVGERVTTCGRQRFKVLTC